MMVIKMWLTTKILKRQTSKAGMESRVAQVLRRLTEPSASVPHSSCLERLLTYFEKDADMTGYPSVTRYIIESASEWNGSLAKTNKFIKAFILKLAALATQNESIFNRLAENDVYKNVCDLRYEDPSMKLGVLKIMKSMSLHRPGVQYILDNKMWKEALEQTRHNHTIYVSRTNFNFVSAFLWRLNNLNLERECDEVLSEVVTPLTDHEWKDATVIDDGENSSMENALGFILQILTDVLEDIEYFGKTNIIIRSLTARFNTEGHLWNLFQLCRRSRLLGAVSKLLLLVRFSKAYVDKPEFDELAEDQVKEFCHAHCQLMSALIAKRDIKGILELSSFCFTYMVKVREFHKVSLVVENEDRKFDFTDQIIIMSILPMVCSIKVQQNDLRDMYFEKIIGLACENTTRLAYAFRDLIKEENDVKLAVKAIQFTIGLKKYLSKPQAVIIFQAYFYRLQDFTNEDEEVVTNCDNQENTLLLSSLLDAVKIYIDEFDIPWQDTVEVLCVYNFCTKVIKTSNLDAKLIVKAFNLAQLTIKKFLSPNLALLVDSAQGSVIEEIGKIIYERLHDLNWDIRDSAMELLYIVADLALIKFPAFKDQIINNNLPELVVTIALEDSEPYVRATALRCICLMVRIRTIWENHLQNQDLPTKMMKMLYQESEGIVRKEAAAVMTNIYEYQKFSASLLDNIFMVMFHAAAEDLHWEVQLTALQFWRKVIANQMSHHGMIDGIFPSVTFSKEQRKIVKLDENQIKQRLRKILNELAIRGCLGVLLCCMKDDSEIKVMESALQIINELTQLLDKYNMVDISQVEDKVITKRPIFDESFTKNNTDIAKIGALRNSADIRSEPNCFTLKPGENSDIVIDSIVNSKDVNLLADVYAKQLSVNNIDCDNKDIQIENNIKNISNMFIEPKNFISAVRETDFKKNLDEKKKWNIGVSTDINSLMDDILGSYIPSSEVNNIDCY